MTGTAGLDGMGGMHGSTGGGSSMNLDQGREMVRRGASAGHGCCACLSLRLMSAPAPRAGDLMTCLLCPALWSLHSGLKPVPSSRGQTPAVMELLICGCASSTLRDLLRIERKSAKVWPGAQQEASFKAFLERPENRPLVEAHQRKEALRALKRQQRTMASDFQQKVSRHSLTAAQLTPGTVTCDQPRPSPQRLLRVTCHTALITSSC